LGVERQKQDCLKIATRHGWTVVEYYVDNDRGASKYSKKKNRDDYKRLLKDIHAGRLDAVVIWMEDRLYRQVIELAEFLRVCDGAGLTRIASAGGEFDLSEPEQRIMLYMKATMAEAEVDRLSRRVRRWHQDRIEKGIQDKSGRRAFGETSKEVTEEQAELERELIREAVRKLIAGDSLRGIAMDWTKRGIRTPYGNLWRNVNLRRCLLSARLIGMREYEGKLIEGNWDPIIKREEWDAVKAILEDPERYKNHRGGIPKHLLSGLAYCGLCGNILRVKKVRGVRVYFCSPETKTSGCLKISRQADALERLIEQTLFRAVEGDTFKRVGTSEEGDPTAALYERLARDQGLLDRLEDKVAQELISPQAAKRNRAEIERRMDDTRNWINRKRGRQIVTLVPRNLRDVWPDLSIDRRRAIVRAVLTKVMVHPQSGPAFDPNKIEALWMDSPAVQQE
jgi:site-specific DNA recombinase